MWLATLFLKASICTRTILTLVTCFQAIEAKFIFPCNFPPFLQGLGLENRTKGNTVFDVANNTLLFAVINATYAVAKRKPEKIRLAGIRTLTSAIPVQRSSQLSYQANWELVIKLVRNIPGKDEDEIMNI